MLYFTFLWTPSYAIVTHCGYSLWNISFLIKYCQTIIHIHMFKKHVIVLKYDTSYCFFIHQNRLSFVIISCDQTTEWLCFLACGSFLFCHTCYYFLKENLVKNILNSLSRKEYFSFRSNFSKYKSNYWTPNMLVYMHSFACFVCAYFIAWMFTYSMGCISC